MRNEIISWVEYCTDTLVSRHSENENIVILIKAFITQYELKAVELLTTSKGSLIPNQMYYKQKFRNFLRSKKPQNTFSQFSQSDLLFWPFQKMHVDAQEKIYHSLNKSGNIKLGVVSHNPPINSLLSKSKLEGFIDAGVNEIPWYDYKKNKNCLKIIQSSKGLKVLSIEKQNISFKDVLLTAWNSWYSLYQFTLDTFESIIPRVQPKAIFLGNTITLAGNIISHLAKRKGIMIFCIMHGRMNNYLSFSHFDYFYLFGQRDKKNLVTAGYNPDKLLVSGSPKIEDHHQANKKKTNRPSILVALSGPGHSITEDHHKKTLSLIASAARDFSHVTFKFKLHKKDKLKYYDLFKTLKNAEVFSYDDPKCSSNIYDWLRESSGLITGASTTALDAMSMDVPVITIDVLNHLGKVDFIAEGISLHSSDQKSLKEHVTAIISCDKEIEKHLRRSKRFFTELYSQPKEGTVTFISKHIEKVLHEA